MSISILADYSNKNPNLDLPVPIAKTSFSSIGVEEYNLFPQFLEHSPPHNAIVIAKNNMPFVQRQLGGEYKDEHIKIGDIAINPVNIPQSVYWDVGQAAFTIILFNSEFIAHTVYEDINPDHVQLLPYFSRPDPVIYGIEQALISQIDFQLPTCQMYVDSVALILAIHLLKNYCSFPYKIAENNHTLSNYQLRQVIDYIQAHLGKKMGMAELAGLLSMSQYHFTRLFKESTGVSPGRYLMDLRIEEAALLLKSTNLDIGSIARRTGFCDRSYLCRIFRKYRSVTPDQYRNAL